MVAVRKMCGVALLAAALAGCDTTQPLQVTEETYALTMRSGGATVPVYNVYDMFEDTPRCDGDASVRCETDADCGADAPCQPADMMADDVDGDGQPDFYLWCRNAGTTVTAGSVPFGYTIEVTILRAGEITREMLTSPLAQSSATVNLADYDTQIPAGVGTPPVQPPIVTQTTPPRTYRFTDGRRRSAADRSVVAATSNPLSTLQPGTYPVGSGLCSAGDPGPAVIDLGSGLPYPLPILLNKGDTVTVKARRGLSPPMTIPVTNDAAAGLSATFALGGRPVAVNGEIAAGGPGGGLAFTFTAR